MKELEIPEFEREADVSDQATRLEMIAVDEGIKRAKARVEKVPDHFDGKNCVDCGQEICKRRLETGAFRDISCQEAYEKNLRNHRSYYE